MNHPALKSKLTQQLYVALREAISREGMSPEALIEILAIALEDEGYGELAATLAASYAHSSLYNKPYILPR